MRDEQAKKDPVDALLEDEKFKMSDDLKQELEMKKKFEKSVKDNQEQAENRNIDENEEDIKIEQASFRMVEDASLKMDQVETRKLEDMSHLWVEEGNMVRMITQEEYDAREAAKTAEMNDQKAEL